VSFGGLTLSQTFYASMYAELCKILSERLPELQIKGKRLG